MVARSVPVLMASFVLCWFPNHAVTLWGILVVFYLVPWDSTFYIIHTCVFPVVTRLAHSNSCLNPVLCLLWCQPQQVLVSAFRDPWSRPVWKWEMGSWHPESGLSTSTNTKGHLDVPVPFSETYRGQNPQILGRSCALCQSVGSPGKV